MIRSPKGLLALENEVVEIQRCREVAGSSFTGRAIYFQHLRDPILQ
jgi:hypothetical protein